MKELEKNVQKLEPILGKLFLFRTLDEKLKKDLIENSVMVIAERDETIIREGDVENTIYILVDGEVEVVTWKDGREVFLSVLKPNAIIGEISAVAQKPRTATVRAVTPCSLIRIKSDIVSKILKESPEAKKILEIIKEGRERDTEEKQKQ